MTLAVNEMTDLDLVGKRVLIRQDLNVPIKAGVVSSDVRIMNNIILYINHVEQQKKERETQQEKQE